MRECERIGERSMALAALRREDPERAGADAHAASCPACARLLGDEERLLELISAELRPDPTLADFGRAQRAVLAQWDREEERSRLAVPLAVLAVFAALVLSAGHLVGDAGSWALALTAAAVAAVAPAGGRWALPAVFAASLGVLAFAVSGEVVGNGHLGVTCMGLEVACALAPVAIGCALGFGSLLESASARAALGASLALAAQGALHLSCPGRGVGMHLALHFAGVLVAAAAATQLRPRQLA
jgi:hypothetical protein